MLFYFKYLSSAITMVTVIILKGAGAEKGTPCPEGTYNPNPGQQDNSACLQCSKGNIIYSFYECALLPSLSICLLLYLVICLYQSPFLSLYLSLSFSLIISICLSLSISLSLYLSTHSSLLEQGRIVAVLDYML